MDDAAAPFLLAPSVVAPFPAPGVEMVGKTGAEGRGVTGVVAGEDGEAGRCGAVPCTRSGVDVERTLAREVSGAEDLPPNQRERSNTSGAALKIEE